MLPIERRSFSSNDDRQRVLDATDIVRLIGDHMALKPKGREFVALCPFHDDHKPSMCVIPHKQIYHCFSCGAGGNAIGFVKDYHKMSYGEALKYLAERAGIELTPWKPQRMMGSTSTLGEGGDEGEETTSRGAMLGASLTAQGFFRAVLGREDLGAAARAVLAKRGVSEEMIEVFQIGAAPDRWDGLVLTIENKNLSMDPFRATGLVKARENGGGFYDGFRNRVMFPIQDQIGRIIGFGGRRINDEDEPKYINSSESPIFDKSSTLYGLHQAAQEIRKTRIAIITEGYMDTIACHQAGVKNAVATLGTAMTAGNAKILRRLCDTVVLLFDGDEAGQKAAERAVEVFFSEPVDVKIATLSTLTDAKDPDELLKREGGRAIFDRVIAQASDPLELLFRRVRTQIGGGGLSVRARIVEDFIARLVDLGLDRVDKIRYQLILKKLSQITDVDWETIATLISQRRARVRPTFGAAGGQNAPAAQVEPKSLGHGELLLGCILNEADLTRGLTEEDWELIEPDSFEDADVRQVAAAMSNLIVDEHSPSLAAVLASTESSGVQRAATRLSTEVERMTDANPEALRRLWEARLKDARTARSRAAPHPDPEPDAATPAPADSLAERIERLRSLRSRFGDDPRAVPRPGT